MKKKVVLGLSLLSATLNLQATEIIDPRRVYNPALNECLQALEIKLPKHGMAEALSSTSELKETEAIFLQWYQENESVAYLKEFDTSLFHYQFLDSRFLGESRTAVFLIIPENKIRNDFYTTTGSGLEIPGTRCVSAHCTWINDGELFSFIVDRKNKTVSTFKNWRFEQEDPDFDPIMAYYSLLTIHYKCKNDKAEQTTIVQFVDGQPRTEIPAWESYPVMLPKGKVSVLVFYCQKQIKGVLCFDMSQVNKNCPMNYESTVYMKDRLGYERILYAQPKCEGIYEVSIMQKQAFEELSDLRWSELTEFKEDVAIN